MIDTGYTGTLMLDSNTAKRIGVKPTLFKRKGLPKACVRKTRKLEVGNGEVCEAHQALNTKLDLDGYVSKVDTWIMPPSK